MLTSETRGQNSWLNYGPYGETNRTAKVEDTHFADQKIGLLPDWAVNEGAQDEVFYQLGSRGDKGISPREMQSITWEAVRGLFPATYKQQEKNINAIEAIWQKYRDGKLSLEKVRNQINEHTGGITPPDWVGSVSGMDAGKADSSYLEELPRPRVSGPVESNARESVGRRDSTAAGRGDDAGGDVFYQTSSNTPVGFYSGLTRIVQDMKMPRWKKGGVARMCLLRTFRLCYGITRSACTVTWAQDNQRI